MARHALAPMFLAASLLAVPALAATSVNDTVSGSPAAPSQSIPPANNMAAGMPTGHGSSATMPANSAANQPVAAQPAAPRFTTGNGDVRLGKVVGASVYNDQDQTVGSIDDVLMGPDGKASAAVISVGGFLGIGGKLVSVPFDQLKIGNDRIMLPAATKQSLGSMPPFKYNNA